MDSNVLIPNVEGMNLNQSILSSLDNINRIGGTETRYYTIPEVSDFGRNCSGEVVSIKYCYSVGNRNSNRSIFDIVLGNMSGTSFTVTSRFVVYSKSSNNKCSQQITSNRRICCDNYSMKSNGMFTLPSSKYVYGINLRGRRQLAIADTYPVTWYQRDGRANVNRNYQLDNSQNGSFILMQFSVGKCNVVRLI